MAENKMTAREALTAIVSDKVTDKVKAWAQNEIDKLNKKNEKRKTAQGEIKAENKPIADAILVALANGQMLSVDLATAIGQTTNKTNGVAGEMCKIGMLVKSKVKVKGKGEQTAYSLPSPSVDEAEDEGEDEEA